MTRGYLRTLRRIRLGPLRRRRDLLHWRVFYFFIGGTSPAYFRSSSPERTPIGDFRKPQQRVGRHLLPAGGDVALVKRAEGQRTLFRLAIWLFQVGLSLRRSAQLFTILIPTSTTGILEKVKQFTGEQVIPIGCS
jgi:hypothetical protein